MVYKGSRCANCGAKMRLVKVTKINTFRTPEACQYDLSVSGRALGEVTKASSRELLCTCCGYRAPAIETKKAIKKRKKRIGLKIIICLIAAAIVAFVIYKFGDTIGAFFAQKFMQWFK